MPSTWILIADGAGARVYESRGAGRGLRLVRDLPPRSPRGRDEGTAPSEDPETGRYARELAWLLGRARSERFFHRLVLVGPTEVLGSIRRELDPPTRALVSRELAEAEESELDLVVGL